MPLINCAEGSLQAYVPSSQMPWNRQRALHLYRRIGMSADIATVESATAADPNSLISSLIQEAVNLPLPPEPEWSEWQLSDYSSNQNVRNNQIIEQILSWVSIWFNDIKNNGLRDKLSLFWHNHFVTRLDDYNCPSWMYQYQSLLQKHAIGNFKEFVREMGITPAMLVYLNGIQNTAANPNENYARELYELFTLGVDNGYTQDDIVDTARALSGWNGIDLADLCGEVTFFPALWDSGQKTIFGRTGNWGYDDVIDILFEERSQEISEYICAKLYRYFVNPKEDEFIIEELAIIFRQNNFELRPVLEALFKSEHFFDEAHFATIIPGHIEYFLSFVNEVGFANDVNLNYLIGFSASDFNQRILNPTDVAGWPGNRDWINSSTLAYRWEGISNIMAYYFQQNGNLLLELITLAKGLADGRENDADYISRAIVNYFIPNGYQSEIEYAESLKVFKSELPENYFEDGTWNLDWDYAQAQVYFLITHIANSPEFQLK